MRAFWDQYAGGANFGDALTRVLLSRIAGIEPEWAEVPDAHLVAVGSVLEAVPDGWAGTVLGSGLMFDESRRDLTCSRVLALRGRLTLERVRLSPENPPPVLADPGLLAGLLLHERPRPDVDVGFIRHYVDHRGNPGDYKVRSIEVDPGRRETVLEIDVLAGVDQVVTAAARCRRIVSSSLHGIILADSLGIENWWDPHPGVLGDGFKFRDYASSFGETIRPGWRLADQAQVRAKQEALLEILRAFREV
ncbi:MAG: exoV-like protein [Candidatus Xenobia bacterium]